MADPRTAVVDLQVGDETIPAGANIVVLLSAPNRDKRRFEDPHQLKLDREDVRPISFGHGIHHCLGTALARMESQVGLQAFMDVMGDYELDLDGSLWKQSVVLRGATQLPLTSAT